jgi:hypothetical protein
MATFSNAPDSVEGTYALTTAVAFANPNDLESVLSATVLPEFFRIYPNAKVMALAHNYRFETRQSIVRAAYTSSQYGGIAGLALRDGNFETLRRWQTVDTTSQLVD